MAKTKSQMQEYRRSVAESKYSNAGRNGNQDVMKKETKHESTPTTPTNNPENIRSSSAINRNEQYVLYRIMDNGTEREYATRTGTQLRDSIAYEKLVYDSKTKTWKSSKYRYVIRKKR